MCQIGDIILVKEYISGDGVRLKQHPFIIIDDQGGELASIEAQYDFIGSVMSSFKSEQHRRKLLLHEENLEIKIKDGVKKDGIIKADQFYFFKKDKIEYELIGRVTEELFEVLQELILLLNSHEKIKVIAVNT